MDPDTATSLVATGVSPSLAIVGTTPRALFSPEATLMMLRSVPDHLRTTAASDVVTALVLKLRDSKNALVRSTAIATVRSLLVAFCAAPAESPRFAMTRSEYHSLAACWGRSAPCLCRVGSPTCHPETRDYDRFRQWHLHTYCRVAGERVIVDWRSASDVLIRQFCISMAGVAVREAGRPLFPAELVERIARYAARPSCPVGAVGAA
tara:strand:+ start:54 stop:674 length:621 start_codon:yes stop_codon:yes gene_type:complete